MQELCEKLREGEELQDIMGQNGQIQCNGGLYHSKRQQWSTSAKQTHRMQLTN
jgi:hypothetical protein